MVLIQVVVNLFTYIPTVTMNTVICATANRQISQSMVTTKSTYESNCFDLKKHQ
jgi:hypothetical protein